MRIFLVNYVCRNLRTLKRQDFLSLRQGAGKGREILCIWDRASIAFRQ